MIIKILLHTFFFGKHLFDFRTQYYLIKVKITRYFRKIIFLGTFIYNSIDLNQL